MQESCEPILSMAPPLQKTELFAQLEQGQEAAWAPNLPSDDGGAAASEGPVEVLLKKCPDGIPGGTWWNSYRSPVNVRSDSSSSADDESTSEKEEEGNVQLEASRIAKPRASLLGKCDSGDTKAEPCMVPGSHLQRCPGFQFHHANENNGDLLGNSQQITDAGQSQNACCKCGKSFGRKSSLNRHVKIHSNDKPYQCAICSKCFLEKRNLASHLRRHMKSSHSERKSYKCPDCGERFITSTSYAKHRQMHAIEMTYQCPECERNYTAQRHLVRHLMKAHAGANLYKCSACEKGFVEEMDLVRHQTKIHKRGIFYRCPDCGKGYKEKSSLIKHQRVHMREFACKCPECKVSFKDNQSLASHWRTHEKEELNKSLNYKMHFVKSPPHVMPRGSNMEEKTSVCPDCGKCVRDERCIADQLIHTREQQYQCPSEGGVFKEGAPLAPNQIVQEEVKSNQLCDGGQPPSTGSMLALQPNTTMDENLHICPDCGKVFKDNQYFANHLRSHTQENQSKNASQGETFEERMLPAGRQEAHPKQSLHKCPTCQRAYSTEYNLRRHQRQQRECRPKSANRRKDVAFRKSFAKCQKAHMEGQPRQHKCSHCGKQFRAKNLLNRHQKTHAEGKPYQCTDCGKNLAYEHIFAHYREVHGEGQLCPYKCAHCGKAFRTPSSLRRHQQLHTEGKPYRCSTCGKGFAFRDALAHHQEIHILMQARLHTCLFCGKTFPTSDSLNRHTRIHMETRSYQCSVCEKAFGTKYSLRRHLDMHAKRSPGHSSSGGKDLGNSSDLAKDQSSDTEENSNNWSDSSTLSGHQEVHLEGKNPECCRSTDDSVLTKPQGTHLEEFSAKRLGYERTFRDSSELPKDQASHADGHFNKWPNNSVCPGHQEVCMEENPLKCAESGDSSALPQHQNAHSEEHSTEWLDGDKTVKGGSVLIKYQLTHTEENVNELTEYSVYSGQQGTPVEDNLPECSENGGIFLASSTPIKHQSTRREEKSVRGLDGKQFSKDNSPNSSNRKINKKHCTCSDCGKSFKDNYSLKRHKKVHSLVRPYHCQKCEKSFVAPSDLARHQTSHTDLRPYQCTECGKCFKRKSSVDKHQESHTDLRPYQCTECGKCFKRKSSVDKHQKTHNGEKPYCCSYCGKRVTTNSILSCHLRIHTGERPYKCTECDKSYRTSSALKKHLQKHLNSVEVPRVDELNQTS